MTKPISPKQAKAASHPDDKRAHLKKLVVRRLNRELKKGLRSVTVENCIDAELAQEIAEEFRVQGWGVEAEDHRIRVGRFRSFSQNGCNVAWRYKFSDPAQKCP